MLNYAARHAELRFQPTVFNPRTKTELATSQGRMTADYAKAGNERAVTGDMPLLSHLAFCY